MLYFSKFIAIPISVTTCCISSSCHSETQPSKTVTEAPSHQLSPLETEVLRLLRKKPFNRELIYKQTKLLDLEQKLSLVNRLAEEHSIERMNTIKARVQLSTIDKSQTIEASEQRQKETLNDINSILREKAREEGLLKE